MMYSPTNLFISFCNAPHSNHFFVGLDCKMDIIQICEEHKCSQGKYSSHCGKDCNVYIFHTLM